MIYTHPRSPIFLTQFYPCTVSTSFTNPEQQSHHKCSNTISILFAHSCLWPYGLKTHGTIRSTSSQTTLTPVVQKQDLIPERASKASRMPPSPHDPNCWASDQWYSPPCCLIVMIPPTGHTGAPVICTVGPQTMRTPALLSTKITSQTGAGATDTGFN